MHSLGFCISELNEAIKAAKPNKQPGREVIAWHLPKQRYNHEDVRYHHLFLGDDHDLSRYRNSRSTWLPGCQQPNSRP